eukprot:TRINITY_DN66427_c7_g2_i1.p1 TRINITY_DN66427_c7_g2~~TRINITY_DN66427_c7_g2_i1.p1  ORF type:complete len:147 (-),score=11.71 TRINITY_DN66427_c7_g2_i1:154-594(-)
MAEPSVLPRPGSCWCCNAGTYFTYHSELIVGDFFVEVKKIEDNTFDLLYDRGSLCAITPDMRAEYIAQMKRVLKPNAYIYQELVIRPEETRTAGPPHHISQSVVGDLYGDAWKVCEQEGVVYEAPAPGSPGPPFGLFPAGLVKPVK